MEFLQLKPTAFCPPEAPSSTLQYDPVFPFLRSQMPSDVGDYNFMRTLLGGKGANLAIMCRIGLSVPPGCTITTEVCDAFNKNGKKLPKGVWAHVLSSVFGMEMEMGRKFGAVSKPLLLSVRSGAAISMPGMMDTVLNLGLNDETVAGLSKEFGDRFAQDSYRRFLNMFGDVVLGIPHSAFEEQLTAMKAKKGVRYDNQLNAEDLKMLVVKYKEVYVKYNQEVVTDPLAQLYAAIFAVFNSWNCERAIKYREAEGITGLLGTAVNVQAMVFGNLGNNSGTGVCFTRNPSTGENALYGEYLINAQGEDVVAGIRTPMPISTLQKEFPEQYQSLLKNVQILEKHYGDMQDIEFTIQEGRLFMLQTRAGKRVGAASVKIAVDMVDEGLTSIDHAIMMVKPEHLKQLLHPQFSNTRSKAYTTNVIARALAASPGAAVGRVYFTAEAVEAAHNAGEKQCILLRDETSPEDIGGMLLAQGMLTARGGKTSHAAVVARGWGKPCICDCDHLIIDYEAKLVVVRPMEGNEELIIREGDFISLNGDTGEVILGKQDVRPPGIDDSLHAVRLMKWVDEKRKMKVLANADTPSDALEARRNGAEGIGLTRTEHMFFSEDRIRVVRRMILAQDADHREQALKELLVLQRGDFEGILEAMNGLPVTVRLLDPPLHEFLPAASEIDEAFARDVGSTLLEARRNIEKLQEVNPMLGLRGCRLGIVKPELITMQARAVIEAALNNKFNKNLDPHPEIMIPLIGTAAEYNHQANLIRNAINAVFEERKQRVDYHLGTMMEVPRACLTAAEIAEAGPEFFSYGTNDLTQMTFGYSRDDCGDFLPTYLKEGILDTDPFKSIDEVGVGKLIEMSATIGRQAAERRALAAQARGEKVTAADLFHAGVCGEHGGDPKSVRFFAKLRLDYVSCSPFRVPVARLAAAQAIIEEEEAKKKF